MEEEVKYKLDQIANIWNHFIWEYSSCQRKIKFDKEVKFNYLGIILGYFTDTFEIINYSSPKSYIEQFTSQISLLQSIYIQQDLIEELLRIFKLKINKGNLKNDPNYSVNRNIRNELVGHPIRREKSNGALISSCIYGFSRETDKIIYLKYHRDKDFELELIDNKMSEIISRHKKFLVLYLDKIENKLVNILKKFIKEIDNLKSLIEEKSFKEILDVSNVFFESIFKYDFIYDKESLLIIYSRRREHQRYQNLIDRFYKDLKDSLNETKEYASKLIETKNDAYEMLTKQMNLNIGAIDVNEKKSNDFNTSTYHYELGKLASKNNPRDFKFFADYLKEKCSGNELVMGELEHMEANINNNIEYYCAYRLIWTELMSE